MDTTSNGPHGTTATAVITRHTDRQGQADRQTRTQHTTKQRANKRGRGGLFVL